MTDVKESTKRKTAVVIGFIGGLWIGFLGRLAFTQEAVAWSEVGLYTLAAAIIFAVLGWFFPRAITFLLYPFTLFGVGS